MSRRIAIACLALLAGCGSKGVAIDLTIKPNCVDDNNAVDHLSLNANLTPPASAPAPITIPGSSFFANVGVSNRLVLILPDATTHVDVSVTADDAAMPANALGFGEIGFAIDGPNVYPATLDLGNSRCPAMMTSGGDGGVVQTPITFVGASAIPPTQGDTMTTIAQPTGVMPGDTLLAIITAYNGGDVVTPPDTTWTMIDSVKTVTGIAATSYVHRVGANETGPYPFYFPANRVPTGAIVAYRNVDANQPIDTANEAGKAFPMQPWQLPPVQVTQTGVAVAMFLHLLQSEQATTTWNAPMGMTTRVVGQSHGAIAVFDENVAAGTTLSMPPIQATAADGQDYAVVEVVVLRPQ